MWWIWLVCILGALLLLFLLVCLLIALLNKKLFGVRGKDPDNPCYLHIEDYPELKREDYETQCEGKAIRGYVYSLKEEANPKGFIVLAHGFFGSHVQYLVDIDFLCKQGYRVLAFDQYGVGMSDGESQVSLAHGILCLNEVIKDVEKRNLQGDLPILLYGHSWGAYCCAGALKDHPEISKAVLRSGPTSPERAAFDLIWLNAKPLGVLLAPFFPLASLLVLGKKKLVNVTSSLEKNQTTQCLLLQAKNDKMVAYSHSLASYFLKHPQSNVSVFLTEEGGHNTIITEEGTANYQKAVKEWDSFKKIENEEEREKKQEEFLASLHRVPMYPYNETTTNEIVRFLSK